MILGQLIYVRKGPLNRHKFDANAVPALFVGWRYNSGPKSHKGVYLALDYASVKSRNPGYSVAMSVPCEEVSMCRQVILFCRCELQLADFRDPSLAEFLPKEVSFKFAH